MKQMKLVLAILIALAMATPALAINVEWHGDFNHRASYSTQGDLSRRWVSDKTSYMNIGGQANFATSRAAANAAGLDTKKSKNDADMFAEIKYRLWMQASDDEQKVKGVLALEIGSEKFGGDAMELGGDETDGVFELRWAYTDIELPFDPASRVSVGLQPVRYNALLWSDNAAGVKWTRKEGQWAYSLGWWRAKWENDASDKRGNATDNNENAEFYAADATYKFDTGSANGFLIVRDNGDDFGVGTVTVERDTSIWLGLSGNNSWGDLSATATGIYLTGDVKTTAGELDRKAFLLHAQADYKVGNTTYILGGLYTSGDDDPNDGDLENFDVIDISTSIIGSICIFDNYADDNSFTQAPYVYDMGYQLFYLGAKHKLNSKTELRARYLWHNTAEDDAFGEDEIGHEFVVGASYTIMKGLKAEINAGYLIAGDLMDELASDDDADNIFRTDARLRFKF